MNIKKITQKALLLLSMMVILLIAAIAAMFTSSDVVTNSFTGASFDIKLLEESWNYHNDVTPNEELDKNPKIRNDGDTDAYVFLEVRVPYYSNIRYETNNAGSWAWGNIPCVKFLNSDDEYSKTADFKQFVNPNWMLLSETNDTEKEIYTYVYAYVTNITDNYGNVIGSVPELSVLSYEENNITSELFNKIKLFNARETSELPVDNEQDIAGKTIAVDVYAHGIQVQNLIESGVTSTDPLTVWEILSSENA